MLALERVAVCDRIFISTAVKNVYSSIGVRN